jgi:glycosyltransferase involved in cell wall biosynthesis
MRVLFLVHDFLPAHPSGTEVYTGAVAQRLSERGHEVRIFATEKDIGRAHLALEQRTWQGLVVHELVNNLFYRDFRETWDHPPAAAAFGRVLDEFRPEVVHVMHLLYLSVGCVEEAHRRGIPLFFTLHDFWLQCARFGQRLHPDGARCDTIDFARCGTCLARFKFAQSDLERRAGHAIAGVRRATGIDLSGPARAAGERMRKAAATDWQPPPPEEAAAFEARARERDAELRARVVPCIERFFAPSRFLRAQMVALGLPEERTETLAYGLDLEPFRGFRREPAEKLRVAFLGTLAPHKAPHLLLDAFARLAPELRARATLTLYGPTHHFPEYVARLEREARALGGRLAGAVPREGVPAALAATDLLVVPSVWYENSPFAIHEARATRTPLLVSDLGGMAELVEDGREGWRFRPGDAAHLAEHLARVLRDPGLLARLPFGPPETHARQSSERHAAASRHAGALVLRRARYRPSSSAADRAGALATARGGHGSVGRDVAHERGPAGTTRCQRGWSCDPRKRSTARTSLRPLAESASARARSPSGTSCARSAPTSSTCSTGSGSRATSCSARRSRRSRPSSRCTTSGRPASSPSASSRSRASSARRGSRPRRASAAPPRCRRARRGSPSRRRAWRCSSARRISRASSSSRGPCSRRRARMPRRSRATSARNRAVGCQVVPHPRPPSASARRPAAVDDGAALGMWGTSPSKVPIACYALAAPLCGSPGASNARWR